MDTAKTALPRPRVITKATSGLGQLPMSITGMVAHGHGDGAYAHYAPACWPGDPNATISSLAKLFRRLEGPPIRETGDLFQYPPANSLFEAIMWGKSRCFQALKCVATDDAMGPKSLPPNLYLQLDNSAKDNKNQYLMAFLSLLTARGVFKEIQVGFLLVGHTHEDIDAYFSHLSKTLKTRNTYCLADLMKAFMESQKLSFIPKVVLHTRSCSRSRGLQIFLRRIYLRWRIHTRGSWRQTPFQVLCGQRRRSSDELQAACN
jgi:hypothetical protein